MLFGYIQMDVNAASCAFGPNCGIKLGPLLIPTCHIPPAAPPWLGALALDSLWHVCTGQYLCTPH